MKNVTRTEFAPMFEAALQKHGAGVLGAAVSWDFGSGKADALHGIGRQQIRNVLRKHGFDPALIADLDSSDCIRRATRIVSRVGHICHEMPRKHKDSPVVMGVYQYRAKEGESGDEFPPGARVRVESGVVKCLPPEGAPVGIDSCMEIGQAIADAANAMMTNIINKDLSDALLRCVFKAGAFKERFNKGGTYYLPSSDAARRFVRLLDDLSGLTVGKPFDEQFHPHVTVQFAEPCTEATWQNSAAYSLEKELNGLMADLAKIKQDGMRTSSIEARVEQLAAMLDRAKMYSGVLGKVQKQLVADIKAVEKEYSDVLNGSSGVQLQALASMAATAAASKTKKPRAKKAPARKSRKATAATAPTMDALDI